MSLKVGRNKIVELLNNEKNQNLRINKLYNI